MLRVTNQVIITLESLTMEYRLKRVCIDDVDVVFVCDGWSNNQISKEVTSVKYRHAKIYGPTKID